MVNIATIEAKPSTRTAIYTRFYVPDASLWLQMAASVVLFALDL